MLLLTLFSTFLSLLPLACSSAPSDLTLRLPSNLPPLPPSTRAILTTKNHTLRAPITRANTFFFRAHDLLLPFSYSVVADTETDATLKVGKIEYTLDIACREYDFASYGIELDGNGEMGEWFRVARGVGESAREVLGEGEWEVDVKVLRAREFYEGRAGFSPLDLLKNPMILIAIVGLAFVFGMPYLMDSMDPEMKKEFEEQQKKSILSGGASTANPLQNFDMAAWMAGKTTGASNADKGGEGESESRGGSGSGSANGGGGKVRRRG